jgi:hypothetical protein|tara:strand:+ start:7064 stop:7423 length:360 start_codon:yes stop_codon:yes gene_type:complete
MDRTRDLAQGLARIENKIEDQMDLDYSRHGITFVADDDENDYTSADYAYGWYGLKVDSTATTHGAKFDVLTIDGVDCSTTVLAAGDTLYGKITALRMHGNADCNVFLLKRAPKSYNLID